MLVLNRKQSEKLVISLDGTDVVLTIVRSGSGNVKLGIEAPPNVRVMRGELCGRFAEVSYANV